jgi:hypothetical protein
MPSTMDVSDMKKGLDTATAAASESSKQQNKLIE